MSLRAKLVLSFAALLLVVIAGFGVVASQSVDNILIGQIDRLLVGLQERATRFAPTPDSPLRPPSDPEEVGDGVYRRDAAEIWIDSEGEVLIERPSGFVDDPDPLPDVDALSGDGPATIPSIDGSLDYRAISVERADGLATVVLAIPLDDVDAANSDMIGVLVLSGLGVLLIGGAATWATVDRSMRPVGEMVNTAEAIASGDLSRRVKTTGDDNELGRLGTSLNEMLHTIESLVDREREAQSRLRQFIGDASHELRTPITAISGYAELRERGGMSTPEDEDRAWDRIASESKRMQTLVEDLITLTRLGQSQALDLEPVDLVAVSRDAIADHNAIDREHPVELTGAASAHVVGDRQRIHQVVSGLLSNVRTHTPAGTTATVRIESGKEDNVSLVVEDDGPGIPDKALDHIFDRFYRADDSRSRRSGGSGLGLAIVKAIVEAHGGEISVTNAGGARFTVELPAATESEL